MRHFGPSPHPVRVRTNRQFGTTFMVGIAWSAFQDAKDGPLVCCEVMRGKELVKQKQLCAISALPPTLCELGPTASLAPHSWWVLPGALFRTQKTARWCVAR